MCGQYFLSYNYYLLKYFRYLFIDSLYVPLEMFTKALDMMNRAVSGHFQPGVKENMAYFTLNERRNMADPATVRSGSPGTSIPQTPTAAEVRFTADSMTTCSSHSCSALCFLNIHTVSNFVV